MYGLYTAVLRAPPPHYHRKITIFRGPIKIKIVPTASKMFPFRYLLIVIALLLAPPAYSWNAFGHMLIAELALQKLDPKLQRKIESLSFSLVKQQDSDKRLYLMRTYQGASAFAQLSVFADDWRNESIGSLFEQYGQNIPANFADIADQNTSRWHYKNTAFAAEGLRQPGSQASARQCDLSESVDVAWAVEQLQEAFKEAETQQDQVLLLALLIHFVSDAHQPLHGISRVDDNCESDRGGNRFCFVYHNNSYSCETNLHSLWDRGVGFFESFDRIADAAEYVSRVEVDENQAKNLNPDDWLAEGFRKARFIYSIKDGSGGDSYYIKEGQIISYERIALAAERLALILNQLY